jgi:hypothetical protein
MKPLCVLKVAVVFARVETFCMAIEEPEGPSMAAGRKVSPDGDQRSRLSNFNKSLEPPQAHLTRTRGFLTTENKIHIITFVHWN